MGLTRSNSPTFAALTPRTRRGCDGEDKMCGYFYFVSGRLSLVSISPIPHYKARVSSDAQIVERGGRQPAMISLHTINFYNSTIDSNNNDPRPEI